MKKYNTWISYVSNPVNLSPGQTGKQVVNLSLLATSFGVKYAARRGVKYAARRGIKYAARRGVKYAVSRGVIYAASWGVN